MLQSQTITPLCFYRACSARAFTENKHHGDNAEQSNSSLYVHYNSGMCCTIEPVEHDNLNGLGRMLTKHYWMPASSLTRKATPFNDDQALTVVLNSYCCRPIWGTQCVGRLRPGSFERCAVVRHSRGRGRKQRKLKICLLHGYFGQSYYMNMTGERLRASLNRRYIKLRAVIPSHLPADLDL